MTSSRVAVFRWFVWLAFSASKPGSLEETSAPYAISENELFHDLWPTFCPGDILVADRNFCSYGSLALLQLFHQTDGLFHLHASRNGDFRKGRRIGPSDRLVTWNKPTRKPANLSPEQWRQLPATLTVRMVRVRLTTSHSRCRTITLVTTLTDPKLWPVKLLAALYHRRWKIELYWDDIKTALQMDMLSCKTPAMVHKEIQMHLIAYNLIRALMWRPPSPPMCLWSGSALRARATPLITTAKPSPESPPTNKNNGAGSTPRCSPPSPPIWCPNDRTDANLAAKSAVPKPIPL